MKELTVYLVRHSECFGNLAKARMTKIKSLIMPNAPTFNNSDLTPRGRVQSLIGGEFLSRGGPADQFLFSNLNRSKHSALHMANDGRNSFFFTPKLNEVIKNVFPSLTKKVIAMQSVGTGEDGWISATRSYSQFLRLTYGERTCGNYYDLCNVIGFLTFVDKFPESLEGKITVSGDVRAFLSKMRIWLEVRRQLGDSFWDKNDPIEFGGEGEGILHLHFKQQVHLMHTPDRYETAEAILLKTIRSMLREREGKLVVVTHAKRFIRLVQKLDGWKEDRVQKILGYQDERFPQNMAMVKYVYDGRGLRRATELFLPDKLRYAGNRRVGFCMPRREFEIICAKLHLEPNAIFHPSLDELS